MISDRLQVRRANHVRTLWETEVHADHTSSIRVDEPGLGLLLQLDHLLADLGAQLAVPVEVLRHPASESVDGMSGQSLILVVRVVDHNDITRSFLQNSLDFSSNQGVFLRPLVGCVCQTLSESAGRGLDEVRQVHQPERLAGVDE